jgi:putative Holliday junction resolvase
MRALGIDLGEKRVGLALSDPDGRVALPLKTLSRRNDRTLLREIAAIAAEHGVELLVVGEPRHLDGRRGPAAQRAATFADKLGRATGLPCLLIDESLTTREAERRLREAGIDPRSSVERVDAVAAQILLEDGLELLRAGNRGET